MKKVDFLGNELNIDDDVVFINNESRKLQKGVVSGFTPQKCYILFRWDDGSIASTPTLHKRTDVIKIGCKGDNNTLLLQGVVNSAFLAEPEDGTSVLVYGKDTWDSDRKLRDNGYNDCVFREFDKIIH